MRYLVRLDDITPYMDRVKFDRVRSVLDAHGIRPIIGVVPECKDVSIHSKARSADGDPEAYSEDEFTSLLADLISSGWTVAQHGTYHVYETTDSGLLGINPFSEFAGLSYDAQMLKLKYGKDLMKRYGVVPTLFMAPGHTFDLNTLTALKELGFTAVTDGLYHKPYIREGILFVPCTLVAYDKMKDVDTICLHPNLMNEGDIADLDRFLRDHHDEAIVYDEQALRAMAEKYGIMTAMSERITLKKRMIRNDIAHSERLSAYLQRTDHENSKIKLIKRIVMIPTLFIGSSENGNTEKYK